MAFPGYDYAVASATRGGRPLTGFRPVGGLREAGSGILLDTRGVVRRTHRKTGEKQYGFVDLFRRPDDGIEWAESPEAAYAAYRELRLGR